MTTFITSDSHFGHANILKFLRADGVTPVRAFSCVDEMDQFMIDQWNAVVGKHDKVYHLGDVAMRKQHIAALDRCNGKKHLIKGNHDVYRASEYLKHCYDVSAYRVLDGHLLSHIPVHVESLGRFKRNIHGHIHEKRLSDERYVCVCVEHTNYQPVPFDTLRVRT